MKEQEHEQVTSYVEDQSPFFFTTVLREERNCGLEFSCITSVPHQEEMHSSHSLWSQCDMLHLTFSSFRSNFVFRSNVDFCSMVHCHGGIWAELDDY